MSARRYPRSRVGSVTFTDVRGETANPPSCRARLTGCGMIDSDGPTSAVECTMAADATTKRSPLNMCRNLEGWRGAPAAAREVGEVDRTAALGDGSFGQRADDAPRCRVVDVQIGRHARAQRRDEPRVLENVHPAVAAGGGTNQFG